MNPHIQLTNEFDYLSREEIKQLILTDLQTPGDFTWSAESHYFTGLFGRAEIVSEAIRELSQEKKIARYFNKSGSGQHFIVIELWPCDQQKNSIDG
jgi:hypothetical protein